MHHGREHLAMNHAENKYLNHDKDNFLEPAFNALMYSSVSSSLVPLFSAGRKHTQHLCDYQVQPLTQEQDIAEVRTVARTPFDTMARRLGFVLYKLIHCTVCA